MLIILWATNKKEYEDWLIIISKRMILSKCNLILLKQSNNY